MHSKLGRYRTTHAFPRCRHQSSGAHVARGVFTKDGVLDVEGESRRADRPQPRLVMSEGHDALSAVKPYVNIPQQAYDGIVLGAARWPVLG